MPRTIKNEFSNMYGNGKNLNIGKNKSVKELLDGIPNVNFNNNEMLNERINRNYESNEKKVGNLEQKESLSIPSISIQKSPLKILYIIIILIIILLISLIFFYKDIVVSYFNAIFNPTPTVDDVNETSAKIDNNSAKIDTTSTKIDNTSAKVESTSAKIDDLEKKIDKLSEKDCSQPAINKLNNKLSEISTYSKEQNVTENGYCYIGYDNGQRECVDVYAGDICMSGEIFPSLDICINPKLRP